MVFGQRAGGSFEVGRSHVGGGRVDQVAHQRRGFGQPHHLVDVDSFLSQEDAGSAFGVGLCLIVVEAVLAEHPAEHRRAGIAIGQAVAALR